MRGSPEVAAYSSPRPRALTPWPGALVPPPLLPEPLSLVSEMEAASIIRILELSEGGLSVVKVHSAASFESWLWYLVAL